jgi:hypothetical protein
MPAMGQKRTYAVQKGMSALPPKATLNAFIRSPPRAAPIYRIYLRVLIRRCRILALLPIATEIVDYGAEGWLWALFGLCQRRYLDGISAVRATGGTRDSLAPTLTATDTAGLMRLLACLLAAVVYVWQEQEDFSFPAVHLAVVILGLGVLSISLCLFKRGESCFQPPEKIASVLRFVGRRTLEIYAIQLAGSELIVGLIKVAAAEIEFSVNGWISSGGPAQIVDRPIFDTGCAVKLGFAL